MSLLRKKEKNEQKTNSHCPDSSSAEKQNKYYYEEMLGTGHTLSVKYEDKVLSKDNNDEAVKLILEAVSQSGTEEKKIAALVGTVQVDDSFEIKLTYDENMYFKVGDTEMPGKQLLIVNSDGVYYFGIDKLSDSGYTMNHGGTATCFDGSYITKIVDTLK